MLNLERSIIEKSFKINFCLQVISFDTDNATHTHHKNVV